MTAEILSTSVHHPDAALIALGRELEAAIAEEDALPTSPPDDLERAIERVWQIIEAINALEAKTDAGLFVKAKVVARAFSEYGGPAYEGATGDEAALRSLVLAFRPKAA
jgi:hypothetical protein